MNGMIGLAMGVVNLVLFFGVSCELAKRWKLSERQRQAIAMLCAVIFLLGMAETLFLLGVMK